METGQDLKINDADNLELQFSGSLFFSVSPHWLQWPYP